MASQTLDIYEAQSGYDDTWDIGGSRWSLYSSMAFNPNAYVGTTTVAPLGLLSVPPTYDQLNTTSGQYGSSGQAAKLGSAYPFDPRASIVPWALGAVLVCIIFHKMYYKGR